MSINPENGGLSPERQQQLDDLAADSLREAVGQQRADRAISYARTLPADQRAAYDRRVNGGDMRDAMEAIGELELLAKQAGQ